MQSQNPLVVRTVAQSASSIGDRMGDMRSWLDRNRIELTGFRPVTLSVGDVAFDAQFRDAGQAALFRAAFGSSPTIAPQVQPVVRWWLPRRDRRAASRWQRAYLRLIGGVGS
jgi:hypothetical protein